MDYPKNVPNVGLVNGRFVDENTVTGVPGSLIPAAWGNAVTDEILAVIRAAQLAPAEGQNDQLLAAVRRLVDFTVMYNKPTTLGGYGITDALSKQGGELTGPLYMNSGRSIFLRGGPTESYASGLMAITDTDVAQGGMGFYGGVSAGFTRAYMALGPTPWANGYGVRINQSGVEISGPVKFDQGIEADGSKLSNVLWKSVNGRPTTLGGYGITDALSKEGGELTGPLYMNSGRSIFLRGGPTESYANGLMAITDTDVAQGGIGFFGGSSSGFTRAYMALGPTPWANGYGFRVGGDGVEVWGPARFTDVLTGNGSGLHSVPFGALTNLPTSLAAHGVTMASQSEAEAGADNNKPVSVLRVWQAIGAKVRQAAEDVVGIARVASQLAVDAGVDALAFVTPKTLRNGFGALLTGNGYLRLPTWAGGIIFQWGTGLQIGAGQTVTITYPLALPRGHFITVVGNSFSSGSTTSTSSLGVAYGTNTYFTVSAAGSTGQPNIPWFSIGY